MLDASKITLGVRVGLKQAQLLAQKVACE